MCAFFHWYILFVWFFISSQNATYKSNNKCLLFRWIISFFYFYYRIQFICYDLKCETKTQLKKEREREWDDLLKFTQFPGEFRILTVVKKNEMLATVYYGCYKSNCITKMHHYRWFLVCACVYVYFFFFFFGWLKNAYNKYHFRFGKRQTMILLDVK